MRLFVALCLPPAGKAVLAECAEELKRQAVSGNYTPPENLHLTLSFIGETAPGRLGAVKEALEKAVAAVKPAILSDGLTLTLQGAGSFGSLWWIGLAAVPALQQLADTIRGELRLRKFHIDEKPWKPHITIAREVALRRPPVLKVPSYSMQARSVSLMKSERISGRLVYTEISGYALAGG